MVEIFQSLSVYILLASMLYLFGFIAAEREKGWIRMERSQKFWTWETVAALLVFSFFSGVRWNVGVDHQNYLHNYLSLQIGSSPIKDFEPGFAILTEGMAGLGIHFSFYFGLLAFLQIFFFYKAFQSQRFLWPYIGLILMLGSEYLNWMNGIRQMLAATIFVYSIRFIISRNIVYYFLMICLASLFHRSVLIFLPLYFIPVRDYFSSRGLVIITFFVTLYVGLSSAWLSAVQGGFDFVLGALNYDNIANRLELLVGDPQDRTLGPRRLSLILLFLASVLYSSKLKSRFPGPRFLICYNLSLIGFFTYNMFSSAHHIFMRPVTYFTIFFLPLVAYLLVFLSERPKRFLLPYVLVISLACVYVPLSVVADQGLGEKDYSNYKFFWFHEGNY